MNFSLEESLDNKSKSESEPSFHCEDIEVNFRNFDPHSTFPSSAQNQGESAFLESVIICNEINLQDEVNKIKEGDESVFKILSMSFYDKSMSSRPSKAQNYSPLHLEEKQKGVTSRSNSKTSHYKNSKTSKRRTPQQSITTNVVKKKKAVTPSSKPSLKPTVKLFSIREKTTSNDPPLQLTLQKHTSEGVRPLSNEKLPTRTTMKSLPRQEKTPKKGDKPQEAGSLLQSFGNKKLNTLDIKISTLVRSKSPGSISKRSPSNPQAESPTNVQNTAPKVFDLKTKTQQISDKVAPGQQNSKQTTSKKIEIREDVNKRNPSPGSNSLGKTGAGNKSENNERKQPSSSKEVQNQITKNLIQKIERSNQSPAKESQLLRVDLTKGYTYTQHYSRNASRRESNNDQKNQKRFYLQKGRLKTEEEDEFRLNIKDPSDPYLISQGIRSVKGANKVIEIPNVRHRESSPIIEVGEINENAKRLKESYKTMPKEVIKAMEFLKPKTSVLPFQYKTFDL